MAAFSGIGQAIRRARLRAVGAEDLVGVAGAPRLTAEETQGELVRVANTLEARIEVAKRLQRKAAAASDAAQDYHAECDAKLRDLLDLELTEAPTAPPPIDFEERDNLLQKIANIESALAALKLVHLKSSG